MSRRGPPPPPPAVGGAPGEASIEGTLEAVVFANAETGWSVIRLADVAGRRGLVTAVGTFPAVRPGETLRLAGRWEHDRRFGEQFRAVSFVPVLPASVAGIERYLGSGLVRGVGRVMAARLVEAFGAATIEVIDRTPERLLEVEGIGPARQAMIRSAWAEQRAVREVMLFLQEHGVGTGHAHRIWRQYGDAAIAVVRESPYRLAEEVFGIGFRTADAIARSLGVPADAPRRVEAGLLHALAESAEGGGHVFLPRGELARRAAELLGLEAAAVDGAVDELDRRGVVRAEPVPAEEAGGEMPQAVYLARLHAAETGAAELLGAILARPAPPPRGDVAAALAAFERGWGLELAPPQREAVARALCGNVLVVTGGPGTGKTTIINAIVRILEAEGERVLLCAPTGRAAKRVEETTARPARTIHRLLEYNPRKLQFERGASRPLEADLLVVDEMSMVDLPLFFQLLKAVPKRCRLVLVGDVDQLPSVGPGSVLGDLIRSGAVETAALTEIFRQAAASRIVVNAHRVNRGEMPFGARPEGPRPPGEGNRLLGPEDFHFVEEEDPEAILRIVKRLVVAEIPPRLGLDPLEATQVLTPMHKGILGASNLNAELQAALNPRGGEIGRAGRLLRVGDKVMQIRNNYELEVFNGDLGRVHAVDPEAQEATVLYEGRPVVYRLEDLDELVPGYACTIHKSQGSEYPAVVVPLHTQHYVMLERNLLYTAITRGRRLVVLVGSRRAAAVAVRNQRTRGRWSRLAARLRETGPARQAVV